MIIKHICQNVKKVPQLVYNYIYIYTIYILFFNFFSIVGGKINILTLTLIE